MRIALTGTHRVGKTTLAEALVAHLGDHEFVPEPYVQLEDEGHVFAAVPDAHDFTLQIERSIADIEKAGPNVVFDRCPLDLMAYRDLVGGELVSGFESVRVAIASLDLVVFAPIETPDQIDGTGDHERLRREVDAVVRDVVLDDSLGFGHAAVEVHGTVEERVGQVIGFFG